MLSSHELIQQFFEEFIKKIIRDIVPNNLPHVILLDVLPSILQKPLFNNHYGFVHRSSEYSNFFHKTFQQNLKLFFGNTIGKNKTCNFRNIMIYKHNWSVTRRKLSASGKEVFQLLVGKLFRFWKRSFQHLQEKLLEAKLFSFWKRIFSISGRDASQPLEEKYSNFWKTRLPASKREAVQPLEEKLSSF